MTIRRSVGPSAMRGGIGVLRTLSPPWIASGLALGAGCCASDRDVTHASPTCLDIFVRSKPWADSRSSVLP